jgi:hypothetical protein
MDETPQLNTETSRAISLQEFERRTTNITKEHKEAFRALWDKDDLTYGHICLFSCFVNGEPTSAICVVNHVEETGEYEVHPLFVAVTKGMTLTNHEGETA